MPTTVYNFSVFGDSHEIQTIPLPDLFLQHNPVTNISRLCPARLYYSISKFSVFSLHAPNAPSRLVRW